MNKLVIAAAIIALPLLGAAQGAAQTVVSSSATEKTPVPAAVAPATPNSAPLVPNASATMLHTGTPVLLRLVEGISTKHKVLQVNDRVHLEVSEAVTLNGAVIIPVGSPAIGEISAVQNKGMWGKSGKFTARLIRVDVNGRSIRLSGTFDQKGSAGGGGAVAVSALVFLPAGFFMTGTSAELPAGTTVRGYLDEDVPVAFAPTSAPVAAPLVIKN